MLKMISKLAPPIPATLPDDVPGPRPQRIHRSVWRTSEVAEVVLPGGNCFAHGTVQVLASQSAPAPGVESRVYGAQILRQYDEQYTIRPPLFQEIFGD
jgi:hypothetical protein